MIHNPTPPGTPATSPTAFIEPDNLLPIREEDGSSSSTELQPPECDQLSPTVSFN